MVHFRAGPNGPGIWRGKHKNYIPLCVDGGGGAARQSN